MTKAAKSAGTEPPAQIRGAGAIFHIKATDQFMFFTRDNKEGILFPGMIDIIGGHMDHGETPEQTAMREFGEELEDNETGKPWQPASITPYKQYVDERGVQQNIFGCELEEVPNIRITEGQGLVFLSRDELPVTEFAFGYRQVVLAYAQTVTGRKPTDTP